MHVHHRSAGGSVPCFFSKLTELPSSRKVLVTVIGVGGSGNLVNRTLIDPRLCQSGAGQRARSLYRWRLSRPPFPLYTIFPGRAARPGWGCGSVGSHPLFPCISLPTPVATGGQLAHALKEARGLVSGAAVSESRCPFFAAGSGLVGVAGWGGPSSGAAPAG